jgi:hypothetical protein
MTPARTPGTLAVATDRQQRGSTLVRPHSYKITFTGQAGTTVRAAFDDCEVTTTAGTTTLLADLPDQAALIGLIQRINGLRLEIIHVQRLAPPPSDSDR